MKRFRFSLIVIAIALIFMQSADAAVSYLSVNGMRVGTNGLRIGNKADGYAKLTVAGSTGNTAVAGTLTVTGATVLNGGLTMDTNKFTVANTSGNTAIGGTLAVTGATTITGATALNGGLTMDTNKFTVADTSGNTTIAGTLAVAGATTLASQTSVAETTGTRVCTSADYGKLIILNYAGAIEITLPANGAPAGSMIDFLIITENAGTVTISPATADTLITANSADSDAVTFATGHRIGAYARVISDGTKWVAINLGQTTMGVTDTD